MRWRGHSQVERVDLYTRQSLHVLLWGFTGFVLVIGFIVDLVHHAVDPRQREAA